MTRFSLLHFVYATLTCVLVMASSVGASAAVMRLDFDMSGLRDDCCDDENWPLPPPLSTTPYAYGPSVGYLEFYIKTEKLRVYDLYALDSSRFPKGSYEIFIQGFNKVDHNFLWNSSDPMLLILTAQFFRSESAIMFKWAELSHLNGWVGLLFEGSMGRGGVFGELDNTTSSVEYKFDNVVLTMDDELLQYFPVPERLSAVPVPGALPLLLTALGVAGIVRRVGRRKAR
jgi:hypothetical protein